MNRARLRGTAMLQHRAATPAGADYQRVMGHVELALFLAEDQLLYQGSFATAVFTRPGNPGPPGGELQPRPTASLLEPTRFLLGRPFATIADEATTRSGRVSALAARNSRASLLKEASSGESNGSMAPTIATEGTRIRAETAMRLLVNRRRIRPIHEATAPASLAGAAPRQSRRK